MTETSLRLRSVRSVQNVRGISKRAPRENRHAGRSTHWQSSRCRFEHNALPLGLPCGDAGSVCPARKSRKGGLDTVQGHFFFPLRGINPRRTRVIGSKLISDKLPVKLEQFRKSDVPAAADC
jgi:hypothetical protein